MTRAAALKAGVVRVGAAALAAALAAPVGAAAQAPQQDQPRGRDLVFDAPDAAGAVPLAMPRGYALVVGVGEYRNLDESRQLLYSESDAEAMYRVLISPEGGQFPPENVRLLTGARATLANIRQALEEWLPSVAAPADRVVVYFAGHGLVEGGRGYLAPWDFEPGRVAETSYPMARLGAVMSERIAARWKVLLTDACHSGRIDFNAETTNEALDQQLGNLPRNFLTLTATREREQSYEDPDLSTGFGFFTYFVTQAMSGHADVDPCDGRITADEVIEYVRSNVRRHARSRSLSQTPTARGDYDPAMLLGVGTDCLGTADDPEAPSLLGTAIVEVNLDDVDLYVDGELVGSLSRGRPLRIPGLSSGMHEFMGVREGYEPYTRQVMIAPNQEVTVRLRIRYVRRVRQSALDLNGRGERLLFTERSSMNPLNMLPVERSQSREDLEEARDLFLAALDEDDGYSLAAYHLGQTYQLLGDERKSIDAYRSALRIDPSYVDARVHLAAVLLESGDPDAAIRELTDAARLEPTDELYAMLARAYWDTGAWEQSAEVARQALLLNESNAQAHLWRADSLRQLAAGDAAVTERQGLYRDAGEGYRRFLALTNFESSFAEKLGFIFGVARRRHADREDPWRRLRTAGYLGLCITENKTYNPLRAREYCTRALDYGEDDPIAHFLLGNINRDLFNLDQRCDYLVAAARSYDRMLSLNEFLAESGNARNYLEQITGILPRLGC